MQFEHQHETAKPHTDDEPEIDVGGRPYAMECTEETLKQITGLARMQCTQREAAAVLGVHPDTFGRFLRREEKARAAWDDGLEVGKVSLRRYQYKMAENNPTMAIWLGKQWLEQTDKTENTLQGPNGGPVEMSLLLGKLTQSVCPTEERNGGDDETPAG